MSKNKFQKVFDRQNRRERGLWVRNGVYYAQIRLDGSDIATRVPLHGAQTVPQAIAAMQEAKAKRDRGELVASTEEKVKVPALRQSDHHLHRMAGDDGQQDVQEPKALSDLSENWERYCREVTINTITLSTVAKYAEWRKSLKRSTANRFPDGASTLKCSTSATSIGRRRFPTPFQRDPGAL